MENPLFRKKSLESISSPEALHDYMRVTSPRLWMILSAIVALLLGLVVYASTTTMENVMPVRLTLENYQVTDETDVLSTGTIVTGKLPLGQKDLVEPGMKVRLGQEEGSVYFIYTDEENETSFIVEMDKDYLNLPDGEYDAELVLETITPIRFLWN